MLLFLGAILLATPTHAQSLELPSAWAGVWDLDTVETNCGSSTIIDQYSGRDTLCTGQTLDTGDVFGGTPTCSGSVTDTEISMLCSLEAELFPGCVVYYSYELSLMRSGDDVSGTGITQITYDGDCLAQDECYEEQITGVRVAPEPEECTKVSVPLPSWGALKARY
jgi:hypothetical protein